MASSVESRAKSRRRLSSAAKPYHHGDLKRVLVGAALELLEDGGPDTVSVREAARRAGVSPGAPFRHFPSRSALMMAVAEEAQRRFRAEIARAMKAAPAGNPLARFRALGIAYLRWALRNPAHFEVISTGRLFDHESSAELTRDNGQVIALTEQLLMEAFQAGQLRVKDLQLVKIAGRALVYGFGRMNIDGHFPRWGVAKSQAEKTAAAIIDLFIDGIARKPSRLNRS